jgi:hypothetical protein
MSAAPGAGSANGHWKELSAIKAKWTFLSASSFGTFFSLHVMKPFPSMAQEIERSLMMESICVGSEAPWRKMYFQDAL